MKILQVSCEGLGNGGVQAVIMSICRNMQDVQFDILLFTSERRYYDDEFEMFVGNIFRIPNYEGENRIRLKLDYYIRFFRILISTYKLIKENGPYDAIHCHNDLESGICNLAAYLAGVKIRVSHAHTSNNMFRKKNIISYIYKKMLQNFMNISSNIKIGCTKNALISVFGKKYIDRNSSFIISNPINLKQFKKSEKNIESDSVNIVHVGRFCENKNQMILIDILPYILNEYPNAKIQLIGSGEEYKIELQKRAELLGVEASVDFLPHNSNVKEILDKARLFIFPSISEGFGIAVIEAQAMEVPCLVSDSVPKEVDCGLCKFISLSERKKVWAKEAMEIIKHNKTLKLNNTKISDLDVENYVKKLKTIYGGEIS